MYKERDFNRMARYTKVKNPGQVAQLVCRMPWNSKEAGCNAVKDWDCWKGRASRQ